MSMASPSSQAAPPPLSPTSAGQGAYSQLQPSTSKLTAPPFVLTSAPAKAGSGVRGAAAPAPIHDALSLDFPQLQHLTQEELQLLLEDEAMFDAVFNTLPQALELHQAYERRLQQNIAIANKNDSMRPGLEALRAETAALFNEANELKQRWTYIDEAQKEAFKKFLPANQMSRLSVATSNQEHLSDQLVNAFLDGSTGDDESFARQYREIRKVFHRRAISLDKWSQGKVVWRT
ncbi:hypothetical protein OIV83_005441 [Microbotryomycetes sp. JL201]|nr:hypothetical protein OIV83_005441 [Microbotryomycetes sp. JL201]